MSKVTDCARALAEAIIESDEFKMMQITEKAAMSDAEVTNAMSQYLELKQKLNDTMRSENPDPELIAKYGKEMDEVQQKMNNMEAIDAMTNSRQRFSELMNQVNHILEFMITGEVPQQGGCSGNCGSCSGCH